MCRMILAAGNVRLGPLIDGLILMASDRNERHERNWRPYRHGDGWGIAYLQGINWRVVKSTRPCYADEKIDRFRNVTTTLAVLHARKASVGRTTLENTHPFRRGKWVFCHVGEVRDRLASKYKHKGETDSEKLFCFILSGLRKGDEINGIRRQLDRLKDFSAADFIQASPDKAFAAVRFKRDKRYFTMKVGQRRGLTVVSSEALHGLGMAWKPLHNEEMIEIGLKKAF